LSIIILLSSVLGFSISASVLLLLLLDYGYLITNIKYLFMIFVFLALSFFFGIAGYYHATLWVLVYLFQALAFLTIYYRYLRKDLALIALPLLIIGDAFLLFSLYFIIYDLFIFHRKKDQSGSAYIMTALYLFAISVLLYLLNNVFFNSGLFLSLATLIFLCGLIVYVIPLFLSFMQGD